jgi:hypothetical protein
MRQPARWQCSPRAKATSPIRVGTSRGQPRPTHPPSRHRHTFLKPGQICFSPLLRLKLAGARDGKGGTNAQGCASRGHFVRLVGLFRFDLLARLEPPPGASALKLERWPTTALRERAARPNLPRMQGLTAHLLRHHQRWLAISHGPRKAASGRCVGW